MASTYLPPSRWASHSTTHLHSRGLGVLRGRFRQEGERVVRQPARHDQRRATPAGRCCAARARSTSRTPRARPSIGRHSMSAAARRNHVTGSVSLRPSALAVDFVHAPHQRHGRRRCRGQALVAFNRAGKQRRNAIGLATQRVLEQHLLPAHALTNVGLGAIQSECEHDVVDRRGRLRRLRRDAPHFSAHQRARQLPCHRVQATRVCRGVLPFGERHGGVPHVFAARALRDAHVDERLVPLLAHFSFGKVAQAAVTRGEGVTEMSDAAACEHGREVALDRFRTALPRHIVRKNGKRTNANRHRTRPRGLAHRPRKAPSSTMKATMGRAMFFTRCSPGRRTRCRDFRAPGRVRLARQMPPAGASGSSRAATLTPSPKMSSPSAITSPRLIPMRSSSRSSAGNEALRAASARWIAMAQRSDASALPNSARKPSPVVLTMRPPVPAIAGSTTSPRIARSRARVPRHRVRSARCSRRRRRPGRQTDGASQRDRVARAEIDTVVIRLPRARRQATRIRRAARASRRASRRD